MQKNETVLTPIYRYVLGVIEQNIINDKIEMLSQIEKFKEHVQTDMIGLYETGNHFQMLDDTIELLNRWMKSSENSYVFWENKLSMIQSEICSFCYNCNKCKVYFWKELREVLFGLKNDEKDTNKYLPMRNLPEEISKHLEPSVGMSDLYYARVKRTNTEHFDNKFVMLKGMSSSTPSMLNSIFNTEEYVGGGFYFRWCGYGIVVDPGYYFVRNLHYFGLSVLDIDAVVITHEHIDHNNDMRLLEDLHFSVFRYLTQGKAGHKINWYLDKVSYNIALSFRNNNTGFDEKANILHCVTPNEQFELDTNKLYMETFLTKHIYRDKEKKIFYDHTFGCIFKCINEKDERRIIYTSDTKYFEGLSKVVDKADMVIANISGIYEDDYMLVKSKDTHLGYYGCYSMIMDCYRANGCYPKTYFLSEFWNGKSDIRYDVAKCLKKQFLVHGMNRIKVIPTEVGMVYDLKNGKIQCSQCGNYSNEVVVKKPYSLEGKIEVLCDKCYF